MPIVDFNLYLITDRKQVPPGRTLSETVRCALQGGVRAVQLREKDLPAAALYPLALELRALTRDFGAKLLLNDRVDVALAVAADGVHLGGHSLPVATVRRLLGPEKLIGVSSHRVEEIAAAAEDGADFVTFGPVYPTPSKLPYGSPVGLVSLAEACASSPCPVFALGGIREKHIDELHLSGCHRIAVISAILSASDPLAEARTLLQQLVA